MPAPRPRLLLVEDEATISVALGRLLDRWGFDTVATRTVAEARALLGSVAVDLVVIDFRLPDVRGDDFLHWLQKEYPDLAKRSLFITGDFGEQADLIVPPSGPRQISHRPAKVISPRLASAIANGCLSVCRHS